MLPEEFFRPGVEPEDLPALFPLLRARDALGAFTALFRGTDEDVLVRLLVLREIGHRGDEYGQAGLNVPAPGEARMAG